MVFGVAPPLSREPVAGWCTTIPFLWTVEIRQGHPVEFRVFELAHGFYEEHQHDGKAGVVSDIPGPVPMSLDLADLTL